MNAIFKEETDAHVISGVLRLLLRSLPEPLLTFDRYEAVMALKAPDESKGFLAGLPELNRQVLDLLGRVVAQLASKENVGASLMTTANLAKGPCLSHPQFSSLISFGARTTTRICS